VHDIDLGIVPYMKRTEVAAKYGVTINRISQILAKARYGEGDLPAGDPRHGTVNGYCNCNCRCDPCKEAWAENHLNYMYTRPEQQARHRNYMRTKRGTAAIDK
jgi:hypothetical protein